MRSEVADVLKADPEIAALMDRFGPVTIEPADHEFQRFAVSILNQSISTAAANSIREDLFATIDLPVTPEDMLGYDNDALADIVGSQKADYLQNAARACGDDLSAAALSAHSDRDVVDRISEIRGCGEWTGNMYLLFVLGREDVFPIGDLAVRRGIEDIYGEMTRAEMVEKAQDWEPYRSYATEYIWAEYESE